MSSNSQPGDHMRRRESEYRPTLPPIRDIFRSELSQPPHPQHVSSGMASSSTRHPPRHDDLIQHHAMSRGLPQPAYDSRPHTSYAPSYSQSLPPIHQVSVPPLSAHYSQSHATQPRRNTDPGRHAQSASDPRYARQAQWPQQGASLPYGSHGSPAMPAMHPSAHASHSHAGPSAMYPGTFASSSMMPGGVQHAGYPAGMPERPPSSSAKYECSYCRKGFTRPSSLKIHLHSHTGERPYMCTVEGCGRTFSVQSNMRRHARTHSQSGNSVGDHTSDEAGDEGSEGTPSPRARPSGLAS